MQTATLTPAAFAELADRIAALNKRAKKLDLPPVELTSERTVETIDGKSVPRVTVTVQQPAPIMLFGWTFAARIDRVDDDVVVANISGIEIPVDLITPETASRCDHCETDRRRTSTFALRNADGAIKLVGRKCLRDFLGHESAEALAAYLAKHGALLLGLEGGGSDEDGGGMGGRRYGYATVETVATSLAVIDFCGWVSRSRSDLERIPATSDHVADVMHPPRDRSQWSNVCRAVYGPPVDSRMDEAADAVEWAAALPGENEYERNVRAICGVAWIDAKHLGLLCSVASGYRRHRDQLRNAERVRNGGAERAKAHVGTVGEKIEADVMVTATKTILGDFGSSTLVVMEDADGNELKTFTSSKTFDSVRVGERIAVKGTVKKHDEYRGALCTILTRAKASPAKAVAQ